MKPESDPKLQDALKLLDEHHEAFFSVVELARKTGHPVPTDTRGWSQILVSVLTGINGLARKKGADLVDGSDVKAANTWEAIDRPRFNGVIKAGTKAKNSGSIRSIASMPHLYLVLWDLNSRGDERCRIWCIRTSVDEQFRRICESWYKAAVNGEIKSKNFQLHPPIGVDSDVIRNKAGNLRYPLLFCAERERGHYLVKKYDTEVRDNGTCETEPAGVVDDLKPSRGRGKAVRPKKPARRVASRQGA